MNVLFLLGEQYINMESVITVKTLIVLNKYISSTKFIYLNTWIQMLTIYGLERYVWLS